MLIRLVFFVFLSSLSIANSFPQSPFGELKKIVMKEDLTGLETLLSRGLEINARDQFGWSPLIYAAKYSKTEMVRLLIRKGADVSLQSEAGLTALHLAASNDNLAIVKALLEAGAKAEVTTKLNPEIKSRTREKNDVVVGGGDTPLLRASGKGHTEIVTLLLQYGANPNAIDVGGKTPLMNACQHKNTLKVLLNAGASINARDSKGWTALMHAVWENRSEEIQFLLDNGADSKVKDKKGRNALNIAQETGNKAVINILRSKA